MVTYDGAPMDGPPVNAGVTETTASEVGLWRPSFALWHREMRRFIRQRNRVLGALLTPLVFWLLLGSGLNRSFTLPRPGPPPVEGAVQTIGYLEYFFPGTIVMVLLFTAIFSTISVIEDRRQGFMQSVLAAPIPRLAIVMGKVLGGASIATIQGMLLLFLWPLVSSEPTSLVSMLHVVLIMFILATALTGLGLCIAWPMDSTQGFHAVMNLFLMPMWFLSGAIFPVSAAPSWMAAVMYANPLTYGQTALRSAMNGVTNRGSVTSVAITIGFTAVTIALAARLVSRPTKVDS